MVTPRKKISTADIAKAAQDLAFHIKDAPYATLTKEEAEDVDIAAIEAYSALVLIGNRMATLNLAARRREIVAATIGRK